jgi:hypothetical protein
MLLLFPFGQYLSKQKNCQKTMRQKYCILTISLQMYIFQKVEVYRNFLNKYCHLFMLPICLLLYRTLGHGLRSILEFSKVIEVMAI